MMYISTLPALINEGNNVQVVPIKSNALKTFNDPYN